MPPREIFKFVEIADRRWRIGKFDALTGSYIAYKILFQALPMGMELAMKEMSQGQENLELPTRPSNLTMSKEEFQEIQKECLKICCEMKELNGIETPMPVMIGSGDWGIEDLENDVSLVLALTVHALIWNIAGFFGKSLLKETAQEAKDTIQKMKAGFRKDIKK